MDQEQEIEERQKDQKNQYLIPASIIVAGFLVAFSIIYVRGAPQVDNKDQAAAVSLEDLAKNVKPVSAEDHIFGNPDAPIKIVEFSDLECPFCKRYHPTLKKIMEDYGKDGKIAWVYRHFPLESIHSKAPKEAEASECAAELGGNAKFWAYIDRLYQVTPSNNGLDLKMLPKIAEDIGIDRGNFENCLASGRHAQKVSDQSDDATNSGGNGTPYTIIITKKGNVFPFSGALPYNDVKKIVEEAISSI